MVDDSGRRGWPGKRWWEKKWMRRDWQLDRSAVTGRSDAFDGSFNMELCPLSGAIWPQRHGRTLAVPKCIVSQSLKSNLNSDILEPCRPGSNAAVRNFTSFWL